MSKLAKKQLPPQLQQPFDYYPMKPNFNHILSPLPDYDSKYDNDSDCDYGETCSLVTTPASALTPNQTPTNSPSVQIEGEQTPQSPLTPLEPISPLISPLTPLTPQTPVKNIKEFEKLDEIRTQERRQCMTIKEIYDLYDKWFDEDENL